MRIESVHAREVFDSRGNPTVEVEITCRGGCRGRAIVPSGASTGRFEAVELRDGDADRLDGKGVLRAVGNVNEIIAPQVAGMPTDDQQALDEALRQLDGTDKKSRLGANAILGVSLAAARAAARAKDVSLVEHLHSLWRQVPRCEQHQPSGGRQPPDRSREFADRSRESAGLRRPPATRQPATPVWLGERMLLPLPMVNMISGGRHAGDNLDFQDFLILPVGAGTFREAMQWVVTVYHRLGAELRAAGHEGHLVGDEGGYGPKLDSNERAIEFILRAVESAGLRLGEDVAVGLDVASSEFFRNGRYELASGGRPGQSDASGEPDALASGSVPVGSRRRLAANEITNLLADWVDRYPLVSIEDGLAEDDWQGWKRLTGRLGGRVQLIGDDLFVTNANRLQRGIEEGAANSILVKLNQIGTLWETLETIRLAVDHSYLPVVSARSGETEDTTIADLAVATGVGQIKIGSVARSERLAKYNRLLRLEERLPTAEYRGGAIFENLEIRNSGQP